MFRPRSPTSSTSDLKSAPGNSRTLLSSIYNGSIRSMSPKKKPVLSLEEDNWKTIDPAYGSGLSAIDADSGSVPSHSHGIFPNLYSPSYSNDPTTTTSDSSSHRGHSTSRPFPSLFGSYGRDGSKSCNHITAGPDVPKPPQPGASTKSYSLSASGTDFITGRCATCDSIVRWSRHTSVFRCNACHMVNDLKYRAARGLSSETGGSLGSGGCLLAGRVSLDQTRNLVIHCTQAYLRHKVDECIDKQTDRRPGEPRVTDATSSRKPFADVSNLYSRSQLGDYFSPPQPFSLRPVFDRVEERNMQLSGYESPRLDLDHPETSIRTRTCPIDSKAPEESTAILPKDIYRELETYLLSLMGDCDSLNVSFTLAKPAASARSTRESVHRNSRRHLNSIEDFDGALAELDPKMLLMGDIGENAMFWTGDRHEPIEDPRKNSGSHQPTDRKLPRFNWNQVQEWYQTIVFCGCRWRLLKTSFKAETKSYLDLPKVEQEIDQALAEARHHVRRTLLNATEKLLSHPGRPINKPEDIRFLLILLSNPLLHPRQSQQAFTFHNEREEGADAPALSSLEYSSKDPSDARAAPETASGGNATRQLSNIIKRTIGMLGNLPAETHRTILSWLCRMPEPYFRDVVTLVSGFVSHRLTRNARRTNVETFDPTNGLIPLLSGPASASNAQLHAAIGNNSTNRPSKPKDQKLLNHNSYADDWQVKAGAKVMSLLFFANFGSNRNRQQACDEKAADSAPKEIFHRPGQVLPLSAFYNVLLDNADLAADFELWESKQNKFSFCQYPMFLTIWAKIKLMEYDVRRQMHAKARTAFFDSVMTRRAVSQHFLLHVRRECIIEDSLKEISHVVGNSGDELKKGLKIEFAGEEGVDSGGLRKEWFLLLVREVFDPRYGLFVYDVDSQYCYFNPNTFETSDQYYLVGVVLGLAIYNSTILDINLPPFLFRKLLASAPPWQGPSTTAPRPQMTYSLDDLAEWRPGLARGLRQLLNYEGDVEETFCLDFVVGVERYGSIVQMPLRPDGESLPVTKGNRREFVDLYIRFVLDSSVSRQFEPFKRGFFTVCSGNALALFRPEEIELLVRGTDEPLDVDNLKAVAVYENWGKAPQVRHEIEWFWETFTAAGVDDQRRLLSFITSSDRIPAMGATSLVIKIGNLGPDHRRFPVARTCFNMIGLYEYISKEQLESKLWAAVEWSEGFGLK